MSRGEIIGLNVRSSSHVMFSFFTCVPAVIQVFIGQFVTHVLGYNYLNIQTFVIKDSRQ